MKNPNVFYPSYYDWLYLLQQHYLYYDKNNPVYAESWKGGNTFGSINFGVGGNQRLFFLSIKKET